MSTSDQTSATTDIGLLLLRAGAGLTMAFGHGWGKLLAFGEKAASFKDPLGIGNELSMAATIGTEFFAAILVVIGLGTRFASASLVFTMGVAAFIVHGADPFGSKEKAILFGIMFLVLAVTGGGKFSADNKIKDIRSKE
ncbi:MAG: DoxX family protein [Myxococcota bacterium]